MRTARRVRRSVKDVAIRTGAMAYRPLVWSDTQWEASFGERHTDGYGALAESARYGVLLGYLSWLGGTPSIVDVGCGAGVLRTRLGSSDFSSYLGIDPTRAAIEQADELADGRTRFELADPLVDDVEPADVVVCNEVVYMARDPLLLIDRLGAMVHPGGHLLTSIWRHPGDVVLWKRLDECFDLLDRVAIRNPANALAPGGWLVACHRRR
jgi:SAM-dependent methyltransferase